MNLTRKQKKYLKKHFKEKPLEIIASDLEINPKEIKEHLKKRWKRDKYQRFLVQAKYLPDHEHCPSSIADKQSKRIAVFDFKKWFKQNWKVIAFLTFLVFAVYLNSLGNKFVSDDIAGILNNENLNNIVNIFSSPLQALRSFPSCLHFIINLFFGKSPAAFRFSNILFHLATTITTYLVLFLLYNQTLAVFSASIMAVHPIATESVTWISGGGHVMYSFFIMLSLLFYILTTKKKQYLYLSLIAFLLALTISEKAVIFPLILLVLAESHKIKLKNWKKIAILAIPALIIGLISLSQLSKRLEWLQTSHYQEARFTNPIVQIPIAITSYLELIFWPKNLTLYHSEMSLGQGEYFLRLGIFILFLISIIYFFKKDRRIFFWLSFFIISLLPTLTPFGISWIVAERYVYLGSIGIFVVIALIIQKIGQVFKNQKVSYALLAIIITALSIRTIIRNTDWKNQDTLWLASAKTSPSSSQNHNNLGDLYGRQGNLEKAVEEFKKAIELKPNYGDAFHNLANTYQQMGKTDEAIENYQKAASINPNLWQSYQNLAAIYFNQEKFELAKQELEKAIKANSQDANLYTNLGIIYLRLDEKEKAKEAFQKALQIDPQNQKAQQLLSN